MRNRPNNPTNSLSSLLTTRTDLSAIGITLAIAAMIYDVTHQNHLGKALYTIFKPVHLTAEDENELLESLKLFKFT